MTKNEAIKKFMTYLNNHNIAFIKTAEEETGIEQLYLKLFACSAPKQYVEACVWFYNNDNAEVRVYYNEKGADICKETKHRNALLELLNYINARIFLYCGSSYCLYEPHMLYTPRIYTTVDGNFDITITTIVNYDFWQVAPVETSDYITAYCPELLDRLATPIFEVLQGKMTYEEAVTFIEKEFFD